MSYKSSEKNSNFQRKFKISFEKNILPKLYPIFMNKILAIDEKNQVSYAD